MEQLLHQAEANFITPRLRVFLSVDVIGSTQFKVEREAQIDIGDGGWWPSVITLFYSDFETRFLDSWKLWYDLALSRGDIKEFGPPPKLWKVLGDELIFWKECRHQQEVAGVVQSWRKALADFKANWPHNQLRFKTGAWLVGSPVRNWEIAFLRSPRQEEDDRLAQNPIAYNFNLLRDYYSRNHERKINIDFVGPSMDCGFRLLAHANERKFVISADLAYVLRSVALWWADQKYHTEYPKLDMFFSGTAELKGISKQGLDYPVIWLDNFSDARDSNASRYAAALDVIEGNKPVSAELDILLKTLLGEMSGFPDKPYISLVDDKGRVSHHLDEMPPSHIERINSFRQLYLAALEQEDQITKSYEADSSGDARSDRDIAKSVDTIRKLTS